MAGDPDETFDDKLKRIGHIISRRATTTGEAPRRDPAEIERFRAAALARKGQELWERVIPPRFRSADTEQLEPMIAQAIGAWVGQWADSNLVIVGPVGVGKTWAACAAVRGLISSGVSVEFWPLVELFEALRPNGDETVHDRIASVDVLILDDLGAERPTDWSNERLYSILNRRWLDQRPTVATTNLQSKELAETLGERAYSRLVGGACSIRLTGDDRRRQ